jgi:penicillin-binding protein-related factor A (putative recombinase)
MNLNEIVWGTPVKTDNRLEGVVQTQIKNYAKTLKNAHYEKNWGGGVFTGKGKPDSYIFYKGKVIAIETKRPNGTNKPTPLQVYELNRIIKAGGIGIVAYTLNDVKQVIEEL